jgi:hypothetical protein
VDPVASTRVVDMSDEDDDGDMGGDSGMGDKVGKCGGVIRGEVVGNLGDGATRCHRK